MDLQTKDVAWKVSIAFPPKITGRGVLWFRISSLRTVRDLDCFPTNFLIVRISILDRHNELEGFKFNLKIRFDNLLFKGK